jgi:aspartate-semialdehyde dehydrogenase
VLQAWKQFKPKEVIVSTYQAISGAGKTFATWPEMVDNVLPYIGGEEEKSEKEPSKIWADIQDGQFVLDESITFSANCIRVPVSDGHMAAMNVRFSTDVTEEQLLDAIRNFNNPLGELNLPSAPKPFLQYFEEADRPQTRLDRDAQHGMAVSVGRLRKDSVLGWKVVALSHNTLRGAAGGNVLNAELLVKKGYIK